MAEDTGGEAPDENTLGSPSDYLMSPDEYNQRIKDGLFEALFRHLFGLGEDGENVTPPSPE